jgi:hypothetical protein
LSVCDTIAFSWLRPRLALADPYSRSLESVSLGSVALGSLLTRLCLPQIGVIYGSPEVTSGGQALKFFASLRLEIRNTGRIKGVQEGGREVDVGIRTRIRVTKSKVRACADSENPLASYRIWHVSTLLPPARRRGEDDRKLFCMGARKSAPLARDLLRGCTGGRPAGWARQSTQSVGPPLLAVA